MTSRQQQQQQQQEQRPYSSLHTPEYASQYYTHAAQASQFSLHTPTDPNPPNSSFGSPPSSPRHPSGQFPPSSPGFQQMEHQQHSVGRTLPRVFDGEESPVETEFVHSEQGRGQHVQQAQAEYAQNEQQYQPHEQHYQAHDQQYQQSPVEHHGQYQGQETQYQAEYLHQNQAYDNQAQQQQYITPLPSPRFQGPPSQYDSQSQVNPQFARRISQQYGPAPQYTSPPQSPSFPPPPTTPSFPPPPTSPTFPPPPTSPTFPPPPTSPTYPSRSYTPHTPSFPPPPTSEYYTMQPDTATPPPDVELAIVPVDQPQRRPAPPEPIGTPSFNPADPGLKTPVYTPGGGSGPNGGVHAPGQIGHPNQQHGKEMYKHGLCDCFSDMTNCCIGYWCPCILYSRTNHRLKTSPNSNLNDFHSCNGHCMIFCALAPFSWIFTTLQRSRVREKYRLEGTVASDCGKAYCCVMCTLVQDEREVTDREDERRRFAGPGSGVVGDGGYKRETMVYG